MLDEDGQVAGDVARGHACSTRRRIDARRMMKLGARRHHVDARREQPAQVVDVGALLTSP
ncbi:MAG: hypothetical protein AB1651_02095 [Pseudomonadota bacterium]